MLMTYQISIEKVKSPKQKPDENNLGFGVYSTDHMFIMDYEDENGWNNPRIIPHGPLQFDPFAMVLHYGQAVFEGLKAYKIKNGKILLFRPLKNIKRMNISSERLCIPAIDEELFIEAIKALVRVEKAWVPSKEGTSLYIRPFIVSTEKNLGVKPSCSYSFIIVLSPVGAYYKEGINPVKIYVESNYVRAVKGGIGYAKTPANYAASLKAQVDSQKKGYSQVLWLDGIEKKYIEEVGTMNVFFKINNEVITPPLEGSILPGVTRDSVIKLLESRNIKVNERKISIQEVYDAHENKTLEEAFGTGTAAVISPIGRLNWNGKTITINNEKTGVLAKEIYNTLTGIQMGEIEDMFGWTMEV
jgi:branched-chain amino acid aminotransferase